MPPANTARTIAETDWKHWRAIDRATLVFIIRDSRILLIRKKRGLGAGKINGPGGRIEPGESPQECGVREVQEELCVTPRYLQPHGELLFQFTDAYSIHVHVFSASDCEGTPQETEEAIPIWAALDAIPYEEMWADDILWLPIVLDGGRCTGRYIFDDDEMVDHQLDLEAC
jgi:8-oxo-dGTP diphosphatase